MTVTLVTFKMEEKFLAEIDRLLKETGFQSRTEFIRDALREKIEEIKLKRALEQIRILKGSSTRKTTDEELEGIRKEVSDEMARGLT